MDKVEESKLENQKREKEIEKLAVEIKSLKSGQWRAWLFSFSILVGVIVSILGLFQTLSEINQKNRQLAIESQIRSHEILLTHVLDRMGGRKIGYLKRNDKGIFIEMEREQWGPTTQRAAYAAAVSLVRIFPDLYPIVKMALTEQLETADKPIAEEWLTKLEEIMEEIKRK